MVEGKSNCFLSYGQLLGLMDRCESRGQTSRGLHLGRCESSGRSHPASR